VDYFADREVVTKLNFGFRNQLMSLETQLVGYNTIDLISLPARSRQQTHQLGQQTVVELWWKQYWKQQKLDKKVATQRKPRPKKPKLPALPKGQSTLDAALLGLQPPPL